MQYTIVFEETLSKEFSIEAENAEAALEVAREKYSNGEIVLEPGELTQTLMSVTSPENEVTEWEEV